MGEGTRTLYTVLMPQIAEYRSSTVEKMLCQRKKLYDFKVKW